MVGDVAINFRTYPIRVNSNKYTDSRTGKILTAEDMDTMRATGEAEFINVLRGDSGGCYDDQQEITWEDVTKTSGIQEIDPNREIRERTSLTKLERRVYTFSQQNLKEAILYNRGSGNVYISVNFINYVDAAMENRRGVGDENITKKANQWLSDNIREHMGMPSSLSPAHQTTTLKFIGTGPKTDDMVMV